MTRLNFNNTELRDFLASHTGHGMVSKYITAIANTGRSIAYLMLPLLAILIIATGCKPRTTGAEQLRLARVGNEYLTLDEARTNIPDFLLQQDSLHALQTYRQEWIQSKVLLEEAQRLQLLQNREVQRKLTDARQEVLKEALKNAVLNNYESELTVSEEEARNYYQAHKEQFVLNERFVRFRHVVTSDMESARAAKRDLMRAVPWPEVARKYSLNPDTKIKESNEFWPMSMALPDIEIMHRYLQIIGETEISPIQRVNGNYHFVQLMDSRAKGEHPDLEWLLDQIKDWLAIEKRRRHFSSYVKNLYLKAQSNNEIDTYDVIKADTTTNINQSIADTLETSQIEE